jgi:hypothetical protein
MIQKEIIVNSVTVPLLVFSWKEWKKKITKLHNDYPLSDLLLFVLQKMQDNIVLHIKYDISACEYNCYVEIGEIKLIIANILIHLDGLCGLVVGVPGFRSRDPMFDSRRYQIFWEVVGLERGALSLVRITDVFLEWKSSRSGSRKSGLTAVRIRWADNATPSIRISWH